MIPKCHESGMIRRRGLLQSTQRERQEQTVTEKWGIVAPQSEKNDQTKKTRALLKAIKTNVQFYRG